MARPDHRKAAKDYPQAGIAKGDLYWYVKIKTGPRSSRVMRQKSPFKRSQLTQSDFLSQLYDWEDNKAEIGSMDDAQGFADDIRSLGEEQQGKFDNMPEGLQQGDSGQMLETRANACETAATEIEEAISEWESAKDSWEAEIESYKEERAAYDGYQTGDGSDDDDEPDEPVAPDYTITNDDGFEFDESEWLERVREVSVDE